MPVFKNVVIIHNCAAALSKACYDNTITLQSKIIVAADKYEEANVNCMNDCEKTDGSACTRDCNVGISAFESACHAQGADVFVIARRVFYKTPQRPYPVARTNFYICLPTQCNNGDDVLKFEAFLQNLYCTSKPGDYPREDCFADATVWPQVSPKCETAYDGMQNSLFINDAEFLYEQANAACMASCDPRLGHSCTSKCLDGVDAYDKVCQQLPGQPVTYELDVTLPDGNGQTQRQMRTCVPNDCMGADLPAVAQRLEATTCDDYSATEVQTCTVVLLVGDPGAVAGAIIGTLGAILLLGFGGFQLATRAGWVSKERLPAGLVRVCECACCPARAPASTGFGSAGALGGGGAPSSSGGYAAVA